MWAREESCWVGQVSILLLWWAQIHPLSQITYDGSRRLNRVLRQPLVSHVDLLFNGRTSRGSSLRRLAFVHQCLTGNRLRNPGGVDQTRDHRNMGGPSEKRGRECMKLVRALVDTLIFLQLLL